jgi:hypothetical protein
MPVDSDSQIDFDFRRFQMPEHRKALSRREG